MLRARSQRKGFTLTEMVVVLGIALALLAMLVPALSRARAYARLTQCMANLHNIDTSVRAWAQINNTGFPDYTQWVSAVQSTANTDKILYCPELPTIPFQKAAFLNPTFITKKNVNNGHPTFYNNGPDFVEVIILYQSAHTDQAIIDFQRMYDNTWKCTVVRVDPPKGYGGGPIDMIMADGTTYSDLQAGQQFILVMGDGSTSTYGYNIENAGLRYPMGHKVVAMDYDKIVIDYDGQNNDDDDPAKYLVGRHFGSKQNVLFSDNSIQAVSVKDLQPSMKIYDY